MQSNVLYSFEAADAIWAKASSLENKLFEFTSVLAQERGSVKDGAVYVEFEDTEKMSDLLDEVLLTVLGRGNESNSSNS